MTKFVEANKISRHLFVIIMKKIKFFHEFQRELIFF
jgi:hypothetical protein